MDDGAATLTFYRDNIEIAQQTTAGWDDAIPWESGDAYTLNYRGVYAGDHSWRMAPDPSGRDGILLHLGNQTTKSQALEGCIGANHNFLQSVYDTLVKDKDLNADISLSVKNDFPVSINASISQTSVSEGDHPVLTVSLAGGPVSKDIWVKIDVANGSAKLHDDFEIVPLGDGKTLENEAGGKGWSAGYYVKIPAGSTAADYRIDVKSDKTTDEKTEEISLDVTDYFVVRTKGKQEIKYSDNLTEPGKLLPTGNIDLGVKVQGDEKLFSVHESGGIEGFRHTYQVAVGDVITYNFEAYSIKDSLTIGGGTPSVATGYISGPASGTVTATGTEISVVIVGSSSGTAWDLDLENTGQPVKSASVSSTLPSALLASFLTAGTVLAGPQMPVSTTLQAPLVAQTSASQGLSSAATLTTVLDQTLAVSPGSAAFQAVALQAGHQYYVRVLDDASAPGPDGYLKIASQNSGDRPIEVNHTLASMQPAVFISVDSADPLTFEIGTENTKSGNLILQIFDATAFKGTVLQIAESRLDAIEGDEAGRSVVHVYRYGDVSKAETFTLAVKPSATNGVSAQDLASGSLTQTVSFAAGESIATVDLTPVLDGTAETVESATLTLDLSAKPEVAANMALLGFATAIPFTLSDPQTIQARSAPVLSSADVTAQESDGKAVFTLSLSEAPSTEVSASFVTINDTASAGSDFVAQTGVVTFSAGQTTATISVDLVQDADREPAETFFLKILDPVGLNFKDDAAVLSYTATIQNSITSFNLSSKTVAENAAAGTVIGTLAAADPAGGPLTYVEQGGSSALFDVVGNEIVVAAGAIIDYEAVRQQSITVEARNDKGEVTTRTFDIAVTNVDEAPTVASSVADQVVAGGQTWSLQVPAGTFVDPEAGTLSLSATLGNGQALPSWLNFDAATQTFTGVPPKTFKGTLDLTVTAKDAGQNTASDTFKLTVTSINQAPVITSGGGKAAAFLSLTENKTAAALLKAVDADGDGLTWSLAGGPDAKLFTIDAKTGALAFKAAPDFEAPKDAGRNNVYDVTVKVTDGRLSDTQSLSIKVNDVPGVFKNGTRGDDTLTGTIEADALNGMGGNDTLSGGAGADVLQGGTGNDTYLVDDAGDRVFEKAGEGKDTVRASTSYVLAAGQEVETLELAAGRTNLNLTGNGFANTLRDNVGDNRLDGGTGDDILISSGGRDVLIGGRGSDSAVIDRAGATVALSFVMASVNGTTTLVGDGTTTSSVGNIVLTGGRGNDTFITLSGNDVLSGGIGNDTFDSGTGNDRLDGGLGNDVLAGRGGADTFVFSTALGSGNVDRITDFAVEDTIRLSKSVFKALAPGQLKANEFKDIAKGKVDADDHILYDSRNGNLFYDADGSGKAGAVKFAVLDNKAAITHADFLIA